MTPGPERVFWFTATELAERDARLVESIARDIEAACPDPDVEHAGGHCDYWVASRIAREHATRPAVAAAEPLNPPGPHSATGTTQPGSEGVLACDPGEG